MTEESGPGKALAMLEGGSNVDSMAMVEGGCPIVVASVMVVMTVSTVAPEGVKDTGGGPSSAC